METAVGAKRVQFPRFPTNKRRADVLLSYEETINILAQFTKECYDFWSRNGKENREAMKLALRDIYYTNRDLNEPCGKLLYPDAKIAFMKGDF